MNILLTTIPFSGFYESIHSSKIDDAEAYLTQDENGDPIPELEGVVWNNLDYRKVHEAYAKEYAENFARLHKIPLRFESLDSPKEYNFTTDRIYAHISLATVKRLYDGTPQGTLAQRIKERFTSRDGFASFYANDLQDDEWQQPLADWDANMVATLIEAYLMNDYSDDDLFEAEYEMVESADDFVWEHLSQSAKDTITAKLQEAA